MSTWESYPPTYRDAEVRAIASAAQAGECVSIVGLSGSGKSNLLGFVAHRQPCAACRFVLADCNRLPEPTAAALFQFMRESATGTADAAPSGTPLTALDAAIGECLRESGRGLCFLLDRFDILPDADDALLNNLRALRDAYKFKLVYVTATRRPLSARGEFAELFHAHTLYLSPLSPADAWWTVARFAERRALAWDDRTIEQLVDLSRGYPALLRAACEAYAGGTGLERLGEHPAVQARIAEFWADRPTDEELRRSGLAGHPLLAAGAPPPALDTALLTAKEHLLLEYFRAHPGVICEKDDLIRAVWAEDRVFARGVRDDSLAQLVRRLREKIEPDAGAPRLILTVPGRGYRFNPR